jgi:hypothetical protein
MVMVIVEILPWANIIGCEVASCQGERTEILVSQDG